MDRRAQFIEQVSDGTIPACIHVQRAVHRHKPDAYSFDEDIARRVLRFVESQRHVKGKLSGKRLILEPWQCWLTTELYAWVDSEGNRLYRTCYIEVPRKNGKTSWAAALGLYMLVGDGEAGAECYAAAASQAQASISWSIARSMVIKNPIMAEVFGIRIVGGITYAGQLLTPDGSVFRPLPKDHAGSLDGLNPSFALMDEIHAYRTPDVYDALQLGMGSRDNPLLLGITTAGYGIGEICWRLSEMSKKILAGVVDMDRHFCCIWTIDEEDDIYDVATWRKANPNYEVSVSHDFLNGQALQAKQGPDRERAFRTKSLNQWVLSSSAWLNAIALHKVLEEFDPAQIEGPVYMGIDLAHSDDLASIMLVGRVEGQWYMWGFHHAPATSIQSSDLWTSWNEAGHMVEHDGDTVDDLDLLASIVQLCNDHEVLQIAYDPMFAKTIAQMVENKVGIDMIKFAQTAANYSGPMRAMSAAIGAKTITIQDDPCLQWQLQNVEAKPNIAGHIRPSKSKPGQKIDSAQAGIMAFALAYHAQSEGEPTLIDLYPGQTEGDEDESS